MRVFGGSFVACAFHRRDVRSLLARLNVCSTRERRGARAEARRAPSHRVRTRDSPTARTRLASCATAISAHRIARIASCCPLHMRPLHRRQRIVCHSIMRVRARTPRRPLRVHRRASSQRSACAFNSPGSCKARVKQSKSRRRMRRKSEAEERLSLMPSSASVDSLCPLCA
jgi:hypothetical protein